LQAAAKVRAYGAAVVVMAFDETGQADTKQRKVEICERAYKLLTADGFPPEDIIFDPNIFAIATGIDEHRRYAIDFIEAAKEIRIRCPRVHDFSRYAPVPTGFSITRCESSWYFSTTSRATAAKLDVVSHHLNA